MKLSAIYLKAAGHVNRGFGCCSGIVFSTHDFRDECAAISYFGSLFEKSCGDYWWPDVSATYRHERIMALCFAAAIAESEGK